MSDNAAEKAAIFAGRDGEHNATELVINLTPFVEAGHYALYFGLQDGNTYRSNDIELIDNQLTYILPQSLLNSCGTLTYQVCGFDGTGDNLTLISKYPIGTLSIGSAITSNTPVPPDADEPLEAAIAAAEAAADTANEAAEEIKRRADSGEFDGAQGEPGKDGISPEISVIENTDTAYRLRITDSTGSEDTPNLKGPQGDTGPQGEAGQQGAQGEPGPAGANGQDGAAATIQIGDVTTLEAGQDATVTNTGTANAAVFDFGIPQGAKGDTGPQGPQGEQGVQGNQGPQGPQGPAGPAGPAGADGQDGLTTSVNGVQQQNGNVTLNLGDIPVTDTTKYITMINRIVLTSTAVQITINKDLQNQDFALKSIKANIFIPENSVPDGNTGTYVRALVNGVSASDSYSNNGSAAACLSLGQMRTAGHAAQINLDVIGANNKYILIGINPARSFFNNGNIELTAERYTASTLNASTTWENINSITIFSTSENYPLPVGTVVELWGY